MKAILCLGDSITFGMGENNGWVGKLKNHFEPKGEHNAVFNLGIPGQSSTDLLKRFDTEVKARARYIWPDDKYMVIIAIGMNDARGLGRLDSPQTKPERFRKNVMELIRKSKRYTKEIVFVSITPVNEKLVLPYEGNYYSNETINSYNGIIQKVCKKEKIAYIDAYSYLLKQKYNKLLSDGLHPNAKGYSEIFKIVKTKLRHWLK